MAKIYICSTITTPVSFVEYSKHVANRTPAVVRRVMIQGGANLADKKTLQTPRGVPTEVSQDDLGFLLKDPNFLKFMRAGYLTVISDDRDVDRAVRDMMAKDKSAPKTTADYTGDVNTGKAAA